MSDIEEYRKMKDDFFKKNAQSPLTSEQRKTFKGLNYFLENEALRLTLKLEPYAAPKHIEMQTSKGEVQHYFQVGQIHFPVNSETVALQVYKSEDNEGEYFLPFVDATSPKESYGAGRYLEPERVGQDKLLVDFNVAYNPWCAYSEKWSCPYPPAENRLKVRIEAGEKNFEPHDAS